MLLVNCFKLRTLVALCLSFFLFHLPLSAAKELPPESQLKHDIKYHQFTQKQMHRIRQYLIAGSYKSVARSVKQAKIFYAKISDGYKAFPEGRDLKNEYEKLIQEAESTVAGKQSPSIDRKILRLEKVNFYNQIPRIDKLITLLTIGKKNTAKESILSYSELDFIKEKIPDLLAYEDEFRKSFPVLIEKVPEYGVYGSYMTITINMVLDSFKNARVYQASLLERTCNAAAQKQVEKMAQVKNRFMEKRIIAEYWLDVFYSNNPDAFIDELVRRDSYCSDNGRPFDKEIMTRLGAIKSEIITQLESNSRKWKFAEYPQQTDRIRNLAEQYAQKVGGKLDKYGAENDATLIKNSGGFPLYKSYSGVMVIHMKNEPFSRGYFTKFKDPFDGTGYSGISEMLKVNPYVAVFNLDSAVDHSY
ncbi:hypothetical protein [Vibrio gazogenes]|uniref:Uncharacterized protein n=1 Tax=Vibrio gazogenes DSM 21264 = NBRC 103151 TaxID=1123492 RepID=A0A1M4T354_VIBGA|nr:hypothetical protein [Vibrio gazogenes]USP16010.1 hypothetical protein MKS89_16615 [Vibrio gazogenes]SHE38778.1 hypothetical protein SAMN02745781_00224 [Vibrio gazogenes DSM 21264] [Vibrio gazogenes DSM 21264 = NBRC 103151]SJN58529.1 hypothetical protein BQ6471_03062 [Vibrio gazogenes]